MKKSFVYLLLVGISVYFSFVAGNILASLEDEKYDTEELSYHSAGGATVSEKSVFDYFIPKSSYFSDLEDSPSGPAYRSNDNFNSNVKQNSGSSINTFDLFPKSPGTAGNASGGAGYSPQGTKVIRGKKRNDDHLFKDNAELGLAPVFGGGASRISGSGGLSSLSGSGSANATGSFGTNARLSVPGEEFETLAPIPDPTPIPLDNGSIALIIGGVLIGGYFIWKNTAFLADASDSRN